ncbi:hypothetical protein A2W48_01015 [Candidatus Giovannonibacteria bacterium RIFCSPHIGHO2_12_44_12]|uniref:Rod shape-determining protein MreD n=5 Tax=Candidatus Giovannoniibacteriota TaxID=1752738 RepID=A0A1F5WYK1_9BACT|nr:MAG: hypothetical protein A2W57_02595 [Candidatus Giovannonibacteria bacterium RIFCSPHIGHO2_02_43_16]OGF80717.1 MAG: hypothetical protein A2W48_01015 [Candidatus Giovannonibacteria bacterium RIFCSPHIGHO2_12_44_12]OGF85604.1 MAG: hypothetical protein A2Z63_00430 [Candidatus Giovannonibacteria bacterium RIFCSPLOWO2_02_44_8]
MSSLLIRFLLFMTLLLAGFSFGWEFLLIIFIFLIALGQVYWEYMLLGLIFDVLFNFPLGFFTVVLSAILIAALLIDEFFKAESIFNRAMRGIAESFLAVFIVFLFLLGSNWPEVLAPIKISALIFVKLIAGLSAALLLLELMEQKVVARKIFK